MEIRNTLCLAILLAWLLAVSGIVVNPDDIITEGNCSGKLDYFLCSCATANATIDVQLSPGRFQFNHQPFCIIENKTSIRLIGSSSNDTIIDCREPFSIVFVRVRNVVISNLTMIHCGSVVHDFVNITIHNIVPAVYFDVGFRYAILFLQAKNVAITDFTMLNTVGHGIVAFDAIGNITFYRFLLENTTFENDTLCNNYDYNNDKADFTCSGSGLLLFYHDNIELDTVDEADTVLTIGHSRFVSNNNFIPLRQFRIAIDAINTGLYRTPIPLQGAGGIAIFYLQDFYDVNSVITNTMFYNNRGTLGSAIAIGSLSTTRGKTLIKNCLIDGRVNSASAPTNVFKGGISYFYLTIKNAPGLSMLNHGPTELEILTVTHCNFTKLIGKLNAAFYIQKISVDSTSLIVRIEKCNFFENEANAGSAVYAIDNIFDATLSNRLTVNFVDVRSENNKLSPGAVLQHVPGDFITGVFHSKNVHFVFDCSKECVFSNNQPSVFYGLSATLTILGKAKFVNNSAEFGGVLHLINTVAYIHQDSEIYFGNNFATIHGGAIYSFFFNTNIRAQDICPIQFVASNDTSPIFSIDKIDRINVHLTFVNNTAGLEVMLESIYSDVFYACAWYPNTLTQINFGVDVPVVNGTRRSVYRELFQFIPSSRANEHLSISAYLPCPCDDNNTYDAHYCLTADLNNTLSLKAPVTIGQSFNVRFIALDLVGSPGYSSYIFAQVSSNDTAYNILTLPNDQISRYFYVTNRACESVDFTIYALQATIPKLGILHLSIAPNFDHVFYVTFDNCSTGFSLQKVDQVFACACGKFFSKSPVKESFKCNSVSGKIERLELESWLSVTDGNVEYAKLCLPEYCNNAVSNYSLAKLDVLCNRHHAGRACGGCSDGYGKIFGSKSCRKCSSVWLVTILLYAILGLLLVSIIYLLNLTVTNGSINGLIFFCNIMSINETVFFSTFNFSFVRLFISLINLDLGIEICFYHEMSEIAKTGLQFIFPMYLWLLMFTIILIGKRYVRNQTSLHSTVPVLATLILLSYSKLLRTTISVFSTLTIHYSTQVSNFSSSEQLTAWQPDPNIEYLKGVHIVLFLIALVYMILFMLPFAFAMTFPKTVLRSKKMSYFFPLLDCFFAPYKDKYRYWFGLRIIVLIYLSGMESILFTYQDSLLLSAVLAVLLFALLQAYIHPYKNRINNILDLTYTGIFIMLSVVILYLYPDASSYKRYIAVNTLGLVAFVIFCLTIVVHSHNAIMQFAVYSQFAETLKAKLNLKLSNVPLKSLQLNNAVTINTFDQITQDDDTDDRYIHLQESFLEQL